MQNKYPIERHQDAVISRKVTITEAVKTLDKAGIGVLLICDESKRLTGIVTDGDIRRAILREHSFDLGVMSIAEKNPLVGLSNLTIEEAINLLDTGKNFVTNQLPLVDSDGKLVGLVLRSDLIIKDELPLSAVVMAGGFGKRLLPLTENTPKPMLTVGDKPIIERILGQLKKSGINNINITTHYLPEKIKSHLKDGASHGLHLNYVQENEPLGTAGCLNLLPSFDESILVINGDIVTNLDFKAMFDFHKKNSAQLTVAVKKIEMKVPYGVVECSSAEVVSLKEKPSYSFFINAGIYIIEPSVKKHIAEKTRFDMTDLIETLLLTKSKVVNFPIMEYWLDIGNHESYSKANDDFKNNSHP